MKRLFAERPLQATREKQDLTRQRMEKKKKKKKKKACLGEIRAPRSKVTGPWEGIIKHMFNFCLSDMIELIVLPLTPELASSKSDFAFRDGCSRENRHQHLWGRVPRTLEGPSRLREQTG